LRFDYLKGENYAIWAKLHASERTRCVSTNVYQLVFCKNTRRRYEARFIFPPEPMVGENIVIRQYETAGHNLEDDRPNRRMPGELAAKDTNVI
jgi:hypothetical protein